MSDSIFRTRARERQSQLAKPPGSLGRLESLAIDFCDLQQTEEPSSRPASCLLFVADHPVAEGNAISAYPTSVTAAMMEAFQAGGAASTVLARQLQIPLGIFDVGIRSPYRLHPSARHLVEQDPVPAEDCADLRLQDALTHAAFEHAWSVGAKAAEQRATDRMLLLGEMGIGNSTPAAAVAAALTGGDPHQIVGRGTGIDDRSLADKRDVVHEAVDRVGPVSGKEALRRLGGPEIVSMAAAMVTAAEYEVAILVDGFIATASALAAVSINPACRRALFFSHRSADSGHSIMLDHLNAEPILDLGLRLGEATGALTALPMIDLACTLHREMWSLQDLAPSAEPNS